MDSRARAFDETDPEAVEFVRFCRARRRVGWPELYDEMWAVASRGLFRGYDCADLEERGIGFSLFATRALAAIAAAVIAEERAVAGSEADRRGRSRQAAAGAGQALGRATAGLRPGGA
jgi:hypothetical protein